MHIFITSTFNKWFSWGRRRISTHHSNTSSTSFRSSSWLINENLLPCKTSLTNLLLKIIPDENEHNPSQQVIMWLNGIVTFVLGADVSWKVLLSTFCFVKNYCSFMINKLREKGMGTCCNTMYYDCLGTLNEYHTAWSCKDVFLNLKQPTLLINCMSKDYLKYLPV